MLLSVYEHLGLNVQKVSWLPCQNMEFMVHFFFACETNLAEFQLTALYLGICMKACLGILDQAVTELHTRVGGNPHLFSEQHMQKEWFRRVLHAQSFTSVVGVVFSVALSHVIN